MLYKKCATSHGPILISSKTGWPFKSRTRKGPKVWKISLKLLTVSFVISCRRENVLSQQYWNSHILIKVKRYVIRHLRGQNHMYLTYDISKTKNSCMDLLESYRFGSAPITYLYRYLENDTEFFNNCWTRNVTWLGIWGTRSIIEGYLLISAYI